jgi:hypothetical protein
MEVGASIRHAHFIFHADADAQFFSKQGAANLSCAFSATVLFFLEKRVDCPSFRGTSGTRAAPHFFFEADVDMRQHYS